MLMAEAPHAAARTAVPPLAVRRLAVASRSRH